MTEPGVIQGVGSAGSAVDAGADTLAPAVSRPTPWAEAPPGQDPETAGREETPQRRTVHFPCFDGLRAIAAVSVVMVHTSFDSGFTPRSPYGIYTARLEIGVAVFFLISGFLLYRPFAVAHMAKRPGPSPVKFWLRRLLRIVPAYWLALTVVTYGLHAVSLGDWRSVLGHYGFAQIYRADWVLSGITQAWSLCTEMSFYLFLPLYAGVVVLGQRRGGHGPTNRLSSGRSPNRQLQIELIGLVVLVVISLGYRAEVAHSKALIADLMYSWLPGYLDLFAYGMALAVLSAWSQTTGRESRWFRSRLMPWVSWALAGITYWGVAHIGIPTSPLYHSDMVLSFERQGLYGLFSFFLLLPAVFGPQDRGLVRRFLRFWPVASVGVISYGVYLWHQEWLTEYFKWEHLKLFQVSFPGLVLAVLSLSIASASASYFLAEKPILRLKDRLRPRPLTAGSRGESSHFSRPSVRHQ
ncbi:MAG: acyltransferase family protein [Acidimicrobiales bacterium]